MEKDLTSPAGNIRLASNDPLAKPIIHGNYLTDPMDLTVLVEGIEIALSLANTSAMAKYNMTLSDGPLPACSRFPFPSKEYFACAARQDTGPENHQAGSCKMGPSSDPMAVVDNRLRVYGIRNLRVADASIMPQVQKTARSFGVEPAADYRRDSERIAEIYFSFFHSLADLP